MPQPQRWALNTTAQVPFHRIRLCLFSIQNSSPKSFLWLRSLYAICSPWPHRPHLLFSGHWSPHWPWTFRVSPLHIVPPCWNVLPQASFLTSSLTFFGSFIKSHFLCEHYLVTPCRISTPTPWHLATKSHLISMTLFNTHQPTYTFHILLMKLTFINKHHIFSLFFSLFCLAS